MFNNKIGKRYTPIHKKYGYIHFPQMPANKGLQRGFMYSVYTVYIILIISKRAYVGGKTPIVGL